MLSYHKSISASEPDSQFAGHNIPYKYGKINSNGYWWDPPSWNLPLEHGDKCHQIFMKVRVWKKQKKIFLQKLDTPAFAYILRKVTNIFKPLSTFAILTHWGLNTMTGILLTTISNAFSWMKMFEKRRIKFHWNLLLTMNHPGLILGLHPANKRSRYKVTPSLIGWAQT